MKPALDWFEKYEPWKNINYIKNNKIERFKLKQ
jgi:hypothetical protein